MAQHATIFADEAAADTLRRILASSGSVGPVTYNARTYAAVSREQDVVPVRSVSTLIVPSVVRPGDEVSVEFAVLSDPGAPADQLQPLATLIDAAGRRVPVALAAQLDETAAPLASRGVFRATLRAGDEIGVATVTFQLRGLPRIEDHFAVVRPQ